MAAPWLLKRWVVDYQPIEPAERCADKLGMVKARRAVNKVCDAEACFWRGLENRLWSVELMGGSFGGPAGARAIYIAALTAALRHWLRSQGADDHAFLAYLPDEVALSLPEFARHMVDAALSPVSCFSAALHAQEEPWGHGACSQQQGGVH